MTTVRVIPCLDVKDGRVVKGTQFVDLKDAGDPVELGAYYDDQGADELVFLDITATHEERPSVIELASRVAEKVFIPFAVGGGLRTIEDVRAALLAGADKVCLNSAAVKDPALVTRASEMFGSQCVVVAIDAKRDGGSWLVYTAGGRHNTGLDAVDWAQEVQSKGAGEILLTSMDQDGTRDGYDIDLLKAVSTRLDIPVIASGGAGSAAHLVDAVLKGRADAVLVAGIVHDGTTTISQLKQEMKSAGLRVRELDP